MTRLEKLETLVKIEEGIQSFQDRIYLCKANPKIRTTMALADKFSEVAKEVKKLMNISDQKLKVIENYWNRNNK